MIELALVAKHMLVVSIQLVTYTNFRSNGIYDFRQLDMLQFRYTLCCCSHNVTAN